MCGSLDAIEEARFDAFSAGFSRLPSRRQTILSEENLSTGSAFQANLIIEESSGPTRFGALVREVWDGAWSRETWTSDAMIRLWTVFLLLTLCSWLGIALSRQSEGVATIWLTNGILFGVTITQPRQRWLAYFIAGLTADTAADMLYGDPFRLAIGVSLANSVEVVSSCLVLSMLFESPFNLSKRRPLVGFLLVSVVGAAALTSALGASWTLLFVDAGPWLTMFRTWYLGDLLGMALIAPLVFMLQRPGMFAIFRWEQLGRTLLLLLLPTIATLLVFTHNQDPLVFFIFPALLLIVFLLGFPGTVVSIFLMALLSIGLTIKGHGPLMLILGEHVMLHRIVVAQIFLAVAMFTMFPVAALLEEREALQLSLAASEARFRDLANADELTGLWNRRAFNMRLEREWQQAAARGEWVSMLLIDADLFKMYNDHHGHLHGDECLRSIAGVIAGTVQCETRTAQAKMNVASGKVRSAARIGGEEFVVLLPGEGKESAARVAEEIRQAMIAMALPHPSTPSGVQTISVGVAAMVPERGQQTGELMRRADWALYRAKDGGRDQVFLA